MSRQKRLEILYLVAPGVLLVLLVTVVPTIYAFRLSLFQTNFLETVRYVGLKNFRAFLRDPSAIQSVVASLRYVMGSVAFVIPLGYLYALVLNSRIGWSSLFRSVILIPWILAQVVCALLWKWLLNPTFGPVAYYMSALGLNKINFIGDYAMSTLVGINVWRTFPFPMVLTLAALQTVPEELYDSARIDGAGALQLFWRVTFYFTVPALLISMINVTLYSFNMVTLIYALTGGGPYGLTEVLSLKAYKEAFEYWHISYAATTGVVIFLFNVFFSLSFIFVVRRKAA